MKAHITAMHTRLHLFLAKLPKFSKLQLLKIQFHKIKMIHIKSRQTSTITSTNGLYMQPQTHNDCTTDSNVKKKYFIVKRKNILTS
jgi:hypothetical protein